MTEPWYALRAAIPADQSYVAASWTRSMLALHASDREPTMKTWDQISRLIDAVLERPETRVVIACAAHDLAAIVGWCCYALGLGAPVVHYLYVRTTAPTPQGPQPARGIGIAAALLAHIGVEHDTAVVCTSLGPSSRDMRGWYLASSYLPLTEYLNPGASCDTESSTTD